MSIQERRTPQSPNFAENASSASEINVQEPSNAALIADAQLDEKGGPIGRLYDRISGGSEGGFSMDTIRDYLDDDLQLCEGEFFRGWKLDGSAESLLEQLDSDKSKSVDWSEFGAFRGPVLDAIAPGLSADATDEDVTKASLTSFAGIDGKDGDGVLTLKEIQKAARAMLPEGTENPGVVAQLGARVAMDAADTDERDKKVAKRSLSQQEWTQAALEMQMRRRAAATAAPTD